MHNFLIDDAKPSKIDINPMLDVVFILLIFFVVTSTFLKEAGLGVPESVPPTQQPDKTDPPIVIRIDANNQLRVAGSMVDVRLLRAQLQRLHAERPEASVVIAPAPQASTAVLVAAMDASRLAGIDAIRFAATP